MTHFIPSASPKRDRAVRFGRELSKAMKARGVGRRPVSEAVGCGQSAVAQWRQGQVLPRMESVRRLAEALEWPRLLSLAVELRQKACEVDGVTFIDDSGSDNRRFCSMSCQRVAEKRRQGSTVDKRAANAERRLAAHQRAVAAFCAGCEPSGRCVTPDCALRGVSPLPLFEAPLDVAPVRARGNGWVEAENRRKAAQDAQRRIWAGYTPEERQARIAKTAHASKVGRGLVPA